MRPILFKHEVVVELTTDELQELVSSSSHWTGLSTGEQEDDRLLTEGDIVDVSHNPLKDTVKLTFRGVQVLAEETDE